MIFFVCQLLLVIFKVKFSSPLHSIVSIARSTIFWREQNGNKTMCWFGTTCEEYPGPHQQLLSGLQIPWLQCWSWPALHPRRPWKPQEIPPHFQHCTHHHSPLLLQCRFHAGWVWWATSKEKLNLTMYFYCENQKTVNTTNIYGMLLCCKRKTIRYTMAKPQPVALITFAVGGLFVRFHHTSDWLKNNTRSRKNYS